MSKIIALSGGADPVHGGHIDLINAATDYGEVIWILNSDRWLKTKKGYVFMPWEERAKILRAIKGIHNVVPVDDPQGNVCSALEKLKPDYFGNGGDRTKYNVPEKPLCEKLGIELVWNLGGEKTFSSSELVDAVAMHIMKQLNWKK